MFRTGITRRGIVAGVLLTTVVFGGLAATEFMTASAASASTCGQEYGGGNDMPTDNGQAPASCPTTPAPTTSAPAPKPPAPKPPAPKPPVQPVPVNQPPAAPPAAPPVQTTVQDNNQPVPHVIVQKALPAKPKKVVKKAVKAKPAPKKTVQAGKPCLNVVQASSTYHFPWLLLVLVAFAALLIGGLSLTRTFIAHGHKMHPLVRRVLAGPDHHLVPAPTAVAAEQETEDVTV